MSPVPHQQQTASGTVPPSRPVHAPVESGPHQGDIVLTVFSNLLFVNGILLLLGSLELLSATLAVQVIPIMIVVTCGMGAYFLIRRRPITMLTTYPWVLLACALFHGVGSLAPLWANWPTREYINTSCGVRLTPERLLATNLLNLGGLTALSVGVLIGHSIWGGRPRAGHESFLKRFDLNVAENAAKIALLIGAPVKFFLQLPAQFGWFNFVLPSSLLQLGTFVHVGLILLAYMYEHRRPGAGLKLGVLALLILLGELVTFGKEAVLLVAAMPFIGFYLASRKLSRLAWGAATCAIIYVLLVPVVTEGRRHLHERFMSDVSNSGVPLEDRFRILQSAIDNVWFNRLDVTQTSETRQIWFSRLCYNNVQAYAMRQYDAGSPGDSLTNAWLTPIPRFLWPDKPYTSLIGRDFQRRMTGRHWDLTSISIGIFGECYWVGGWWGIAFICLGIGLELAVMSSLVFRHERRGDLYAFIFCFLYGIVTARSIDKWIVMSYIGSIPIYIGLYVLSYYAAQYVMNRSRRASWRTA